jgi:hypothetical protein
MDLLDPKSTQLWGQPAALEWWVKGPVPQATDPLVRMWNSLSSLLVSSCPPQFLGRSEAPASVLGALDFRVSGQDTEFKGWPLYLSPH